MLKFNCTCENTSPFGAYLQFIGTKVLRKDRFNHITQWMKLCSKYQKVVSLSKIHLSTLFIRHSSPYCLTPFNGSLPTFLCRVRSSEVHFEIR